MSIEVHPKTPRTSPNYGTRIFGSGKFRRRRLDAGYSVPDIWAPGLSGTRTFFFRFVFFVAMLFRFVARFTRGRIEDSSFNRFALNGIQEIACFIVFSSLFEEKKLGNGAEMSGAETARRRVVQRPSRRCRNGGAKMSLPLQNRSYLNN